MEQATKIPSNASSGSKAGEHSYPIGHLGHLTASQETALQDFKRICVEAGLYKPGSDDGHPPSHNDALLVYFEPCILPCGRVLSDRFTGVSYVLDASFQRMRYSSFAKQRNGAKSTRLIHCMRTSI